MRIAITYTEKWRRTVDYDIDDAEFAEEFGDDEPTASNVQQFLEDRPDMDWAHMDYPGEQELDEFDHLDIEEIEIPTAEEVAR